MCSKAPAVVTVASPINIAFIKYWGKRDEDRILPVNDSFSITLSTKVFRTKTSVAASADYEDDALWLNGEQVPFGKSGRLVNVLREARSRLPPESQKLKVRVVSENNFPTAAGMASSAAGLSALAFGLHKALSVPGDVSTLARIGSGSACRSIYGGLVKWLQGSRDDGSDSIAEQFVGPQHWPELQVLCLVVKADKKETSSTAGMRQSIETSPFMAERVSKRVPQRMHQVADAIQAKDFATFAQITMEDSDDLGEVCRSTKPAINYWTERSWQIIRLVQAYNAHHGGIRACYTFDAGPNAFVFTLRDELPRLLGYILRYFPTPADNMYLEDTALFDAASKAEVPEGLTHVLEGHSPGPLQMVFHSTVGEGPVVLCDKHLVDPVTGGPVSERRD
eukprot:Hpha_TRINITY_DN18999_c0_g1::TRINITY_DN18999_c0_g1_i1::g.17595::m.17595/K01597/MVD, mvaD; diphosphomevalonate decarboxylase